MGNLLNVVTAGLVPAIQVFSDRLQERQDAGHNGPVLVTAKPDPSAGMTI
jgi:hypothetical protein